MLIVRRNKRCLYLDSPVFWCSCYVPTHICEAYLTNIAVCEIHLFQWRPAAPLRRRGQMQCVELLMTPAASVRISGRRTSRPACPVASLRIFGHCPGRQCRAHDAERRPFSAGCVFRSPRRAWRRLARKPPTPRASRGRQATVRWPPFVLRLDRTRSARRPRLIERPPSTRHSFDSWLVSFRRLLQSSDLFYVDRGFVSF